MYRTFADNPEARYVLRHDPRVYRTENKVCPKYPLKSVMRPTLLEKPLVTLNSPPCFLFAPSSEFFIVGFLRSRRRFLTKEQPISLCQIIFAPWRVGR